MLALKQIEPDKYENIKNFFIRNIFYKPAANVIRLNPVKTKDLKRRVITKILDFYVSLFGKAFSYFYQDVYLRCFASVDSAAGTLFRGRNYDLFGRYNFAINMYKKCIDNFMEDKSSSEKALFWLGVLYGKIKNFELSIDIFRTLLKKYPRTKWRRIAHYCLGYDYELLGKYELAKKYYWQGVDMYRQLSKNSIQSGEIKIIRRLHNLPKQIPR